MDCTACSSKVCRKAADCRKHDMKKESVTAFYKAEANQAVIQAAAELVDNGRAGTLNRLEEIIEFSRTMGYKKIGLAYCYGIEKTAAAVNTILANEGFTVSAVSCTVGALKQNEVNSRSTIDKTACNPAAQAGQLNLEKPDLVIEMALCLGHDILFHNELKLPFTVLIVKDRTSNHDTFASVGKTAEKKLQGGS